MKEIERKWLMDGFPINLIPIQESVIKQSYISFEPEVRIRRKLNKTKPSISYKITFKTNGDIIRDEIEFKIKGENYHKLKRVFCEDRAVVKNQKKYKYDKHILYVSHVNDKFYYAEIEFDSIEEAKSFKAPEWFGEEVTYDKNYKMKNYVKNKTS